MNWLINVFGQNWKTTIGGILLGVPPIIVSSAAGAGIHLNAITIMILGISTGLGGLMLGISAKDSNTHSTQEQVQSATDKTKQ